MLRRPLAACGTALLGIALVGADVKPAPAPLAGLWGSERIFGPQVHGALTIDARSSPWRASIAGYVVNVVRNGAAFTFALPGDAGSFRGVAGDRTIAGTWIQPATIRGVPYASPVRLAQLAPNVWRGEVRPLPDTLALYLVVKQGDNGVLHAFLRNPEANVGMGRPFIVQSGGSAVALVDTDDAKDTVPGTYDASAGTLTLDFPDYGPFVFTRRSRDDAVGFYARTPALPWTYRPPLPLGDGWKTGTLADAGIDESKVASLADRISTEPTSFRSPYVQSLLIARHGRLVLDEYFYGFDAARMHDLRSASKTFTGLMVGIALDRGARFSLATKATTLFPKYASLANPDPRKSAIAVEDLLTMQSGFACDDNDDNSPGNEDTMYSQTAQTDYYKYALDLPMLAAPGNGTAVYCTIGINLLGGAIRHATGDSLVDFFARNVAAPLDISEYHQNLMPDGDAYMGGGLYLRARDALKLAQLYLDGGVWNGRRVVSAAWCADSARRHSSFPASAYAPGHDYGFAWHLFTVRVGSRSYREYMAQGNGGQLIVAIPELDEAALILAGNYGNFPTWRTFYEDYIPNYIIAATKP